MIKTVYDYVVGTGGIGKGILFKLDGQETIGRNETRLAELTDFKDYCKLHIILHYVAKLTQGELPVYAIGGVGNDEVGNEIIDTMKQSGINTDYVKVDKSKKSLYSVCFQYPNGDGGNITSSNSACDTISDEQMKEFFEKQKLKGKGIVLSVPEVPMKARVEILKQGRNNGCFNIASLLSGEAKQFIEEKTFELVDLLAINQDEAENISKYCDLSIEDIGDRCYEVLKAYNKNIRVIITYGKQGSYTYEKGVKIFTPSIEADVVNTAGAGDCFLGTVISAMIYGLPLSKQSEEKVLSSATDIASVASSMKVGCNDTINFDITKKTLKHYADENRMKFSEEVNSLFFKHYSLIS